MGRNDRSAHAKFVENWGKIFIYSCCYLGSLLGLFIGSIVYGEFLNGPFIGFTFIYILFIAMHIIKRKKNHVPDMDERIARNLFRFIAYASHISLAIIFISVIILGLSGEESIPLVYLFGFFIAYLWAVGIGTFIIKRT